MKEDFLKERLGIKTKLKTFFMKKYFSDWVTYGGGGYWKFNKWKLIATVVGCLLAVVVITLLLNVL